RTPRRARRAGRERGLHVPAHVARVAEGQHDLGVPRRHRRAAHPLRPVRLLHGGRARARGPDPPLQGRRAAMIEGLLGLTLMMVLCLLRIPISFSMAIVGFVGYAYM